MKDNHKGSQLAGSIIADYNREQAYKEWARKRDEMRKRKREKMKEKLLNGKYGDRKISE